MFIRNRYYAPWTAPDEQRDHIRMFPGLKNERKRQLPSFFKYVTWYYSLVIKFFLIGLAVFSAVYLIIYGTTFGHYKICLWLAGVGLTLLLTIFLFDPIQITLFAILDAQFFKFKTVISNAKIYSIPLFNPLDREKRKQVINNRKYNEKLYRPTPLYTLQNRLLDIKFNIELRTLVAELLQYIFAMLTVFYVILGSRTEMGFYPTNVVKDLVITAEYTKSIPFTSVTTYETLMRYLNDTFLPALMTDDKKKNSAPSRRRRRIRGVTNDSTLFEKNWTLEPTIKIIGVPRLRQLRVSADSCNRSETLVGNLVICDSTLTTFNMETKDFGLAWDSEEFEGWSGLTPRQKSPWKFQSAWQSVTLPDITHFYPAGGYTLNLAGNINDSLTNIKYMNGFKWIDDKTRVVYIECTTYCVNTNDFTAITLIAERSPVGYFKPGYKIETYKLMLVTHKTWIPWIAGTISFLLFLLCCLYREGIRMYRTSLKVYLRNIFTLLNVPIAICGSITLMLIFLRIYFVHRLLEKLEESNNKEFISFTYAIFCFTWSNNMGGLTVLFMSFKIFRLLAYRVRLHEFRMTILHCFNQYLSYSVQFAIILVAFAFFFYMTLSRNGDEFSSLFRSVIVLFAASVGISDALDIHVITDNWMVSVVYFFLFLTVCCLICVGIFMLMGAVFYHVIVNTSMVEKYNFDRYIRHLLTGGQNTELLQMKNETKVNSSIPLLKSILRLRGGGNLQSIAQSQIGDSVNDDSKSTKKKSKVKRKKNVVKLPKEERKSLKKKVKWDEKTGKKLFAKQEAVWKEKLNKSKRPLKPHKKIQWDVEQCGRLKGEDFVKRKLYDMTEYQSLTPERMTVMKALTAAYLLNDETKKQAARAIALKAQFLHLTSTEKKEEQSKNSLGHFTVLKKGKQKVILTKKLKDMEEEAFNLGRMKCGPPKRTAGLIDVSGVLDKIFEIHENIEILLRNKKVRINKMKKEKGLYT